MAKKAGRRPARPAARTRKAAPASRRGAVRKASAARSRTAKAARKARTAKTTKAKKKTAPAALRRPAARKATRRASTPRAKSLKTKKKSTAKRTAVRRTAASRTPAPPKVRTKRAVSATPAPPKVRTRRVVAVVASVVVAGEQSARAGRAGQGAGKLRRAPGLERERRRLREIEDGVPTPPSSLDLDRDASAVRTGRQEMREERLEHTETSPVLTAGDVDADWEDAYAVGDEAAGSENMTPDQDRVDDIGRALGVQYEDNEELKGSDKIADRDKHRWELDPASSDDYLDRD